MSKGEYRIKIKIHYLYNAGYDYERMKIILSCEFVSKVKM